ncbi:nucleoside deaminase [Clostridium niameyense]|uniref:tRNA-specific adenosine deaminase n=1 Tax=Clostridium niameyense TaxID=1622073 RepID=A0A6M0RCT3_9CLOT|nr:nucleoside deaminase [Clostridium niameyense]NEZ47992.1 nucleoside deaminase [Clostridium niameyense]
MEKFMLEAIIEARKAFKIKEIPVGAVIVKENKIIARAYNLKENLKDPTAHAEILAIKKAAKILNNWRLTGCSMYVTLEPCPMCAGAILQSRISKLYIGTFDCTTGACGSVVNLINNPYLNSNLSVNWMYNQTCSQLLDNFFYNLRNKN